MTPTCKNKARPGATTSYNAKTLISAILMKTSFPSVHLKTDSLQNDCEDKMGKNSNTFQRVGWEVAAFPT